VLGQLGVQIASILAVLGAAGLAIGLALQGTLSNIAAGLMLLWLRPFRQGDFIDASGISGTVTEVGLFASTLRQANGVYHFVPNSDLWNTPIQNFSRNETRRLDITVGIDYSDNIATAREVLLKLAESDERIQKDPVPVVMVTELGDSSVNINLRCWSKTSDYWQTLWDLTEKAKVDIEAAGLSIPFPQRTVHQLQARCNSQSA
jgi:small conductance mechanosensitive channel